MFTISGFLKGLKRFVDIENDGDKLIFFENDDDDFVHYGEKEPILEIALQEIVELENEFLGGDDNSDSFEWNDTELWNKTVFEAAVESRSGRFLSSILSNKNFLVEKQGFKFRVSEASNKYMFAMLCNCGKDEKDNYDLDLEIRSDFEKITSLEKFFSEFRIQTVKLDSEKKLSKNVMHRLIHSYLFNISYSYEVILFITNSFKQERRTRRKLRKRQIFPYKSYKQELTKYYSQAVAVDIPFTQYLAFYHVAEYFFQIISEQKAFDEIKQDITRPSFSPDNKEDIKDFYNKIKKKIREQSDDGVWNEKNGLLLCLKEYIIDLENFKKSILSIDKSAVDYYKNNDVEFTDGNNKIDFDEQEEKIFIAIRNRVYSVRNAIVHSKEGDKKRYEPFKHDKQLAKEIPLIRSIAEEIIINSAESI